MEIILSDNDGRRELTITVPWDEVKEEYASLLKRYSQVPLKGFRPGKGPQELIEATFEDQMKRDLLGRTGKRLCNAALKAEGLEAGSPIELSDCTLGKGEYLRFAASFIEMPAFDLPDYRRLGLQSSEVSEALDEISAKLLIGTSIELHPSLVDNELPYSDIESPGEEERAAAEQRVKLMLILKKIASVEGIEIDDKDVEDRIKLLAEEHGVSLKEVREFLSSGGGLGRLTDSLIAEAVLEYIIEAQEE